MPLPSEDELSSPHLQLGFLLHAPQSHVPGNHQVPQYSLVAKSQPAACQLHPLSSEQQRQRNPRRVESCTATCVVPSFEGTRMQAEATMTPTHRRASAKNFVRFAVAGACDVLVDKKASLCSRLATVLTSESSGNSIPLVFKDLKVLWQEQ